MIAGLRGAVVSLLLLVGVATVAVGCTRVGVETPPVPRDLPPPGLDRPAPPGIPPAAPREAGADEETETLFLRGGTRTPLPPALPRETGDVRALWVVRTALLHPDSARAAVRRAHAAGFNTLLVQVRGRGDAYYRSPYEAPPDAMDPRLRGTFDPLGEVLAEARLLGLRVHAWVNVNLVASAALPPRDPGHLFHRAPETLALPRELAPRLLGLSPRDPAYTRALLEWTRGAGDRVEGVYTNPAHPEVRMHLAALIRDMIERYSIDGVHLDYIRYPGPEFDYSRHSLEAFRGWLQGERGRLPDRMRPVGVDPAALLRAEAAWGGDPFAFTRAFPTQWDAFRRGQITATLETLYWVVKDHRPELTVSAAVFANADDALRARYQEWEAWLASGIVDVVAPMAYTESDATFRTQVERAARAAGGARVWGGVGIYRNSFGSSVSKGRIAREAGLGGIALFSYDWAVGPEGTRAAGGGYLDRYVREVWGR